MKLLSDKNTGMKSVGTKDVRRCAICKVDLRGRFVYVDDIVQSLLGYSDEELFGKPLADFIDKSQRSVLSRLIEIRSHYESFYESAALTLVNRDGARLESRVVFSLNFIAGNPANYQIIIDRQERTDSDEVTELIVEPAVSADELVQFLAEFPEKPDWKSLTGLLISLSRANLAVAYRIDGKKLIPVEACSPNASDADALRMAPKTRGLHRRTAITGEEYDFTNERHVRKAIESDGKAPDELVVRVGQSTNGYLIRLCFDNDTKADDSMVSTEGVKALLTLVSRLFSSCESFRKKGDFSAEEVCGRMLGTIEEIVPGLTSEWSGKSAPGDNRH